MAKARREGSRNERLFTYIVRANGRTNGRSLPANRRNLRKISNRSHRRIRFAFFKFLAGNSTREVERQRAARIGMIFHSYGIVSCRILRLSGRRDCDRPLRGLHVSIAIRHFREISGIECLSLVSRSNSKVSRNSPDRRRGLVRQPRWLITAN